MTHAREITIVGAGLVGALLATLLAQRGFTVSVFERRPDLRRAGFSGGRSINLALAERGWHGLRLAGLQERMRAIAVMMRGRMVHDIAGHTNLQRYGRDDSEVIWSVNRGALNGVLLDAAEAAGATIHFDWQLDSIDWNSSTLSFRSENNDSCLHVAPILIGSDGAGSVVRQAMAGAIDLNERFEALDHGYKELEIPAVARAEGKGLRAADQGHRAEGEGLRAVDQEHGAEGRGLRAEEQEQVGANFWASQPSALSPQPSLPRPQPSPFAIEPNALHIWPRGNYMCIALPNAEGSFTVTLFMPNEGNPSFANVRNADEVRALFARDFADALPLIPDLEHDYTHNPTGLLGTLYLDRWHLDGRALLVGDAAHAIVPFHGQGMNAGFEDAVELAELLAATPDDSAQVFAEFERRRKPNCDAIARMALENYIEMRDRVDDADYLLMRELDRTLAARHPDRWMPRYSMVTFTRIPYATALERGKIQTRILGAALAGKKSVAEIDLAAIDARVSQELNPLPTFA